MRCNPSALVVGFLVGWLPAARTDSPAVANDRPYQAQWIWRQVASPEPFQFARFR